MRKTQRQSRRERLVAWLRHADELLAEVHTTNATFNSQRAPHVPGSNWPASEW
jgi:hypothetical protein